MLRGQQSASAPAVNGSAAFPSGEHAYGCADRPAGIRFYFPKESFFRPYALLRQMRLAGEQLTIGFADEEVLIEGRGLHTLYVGLADQTLAWVWEQGERFEQVAQDPVWIRRIQRVPLRDKPQT